MYITNEDPPANARAEPKAKYRHIPVEKLSHGQCLNILNGTIDINAVRMAISRHRKKSNNAHKYVIIVDKLFIKVFCSRM